MKFVAPRFKIIAFKSLILSLLDFLFIIIFRFRTSNCQSQTTARLPEPFFVFDVGHYSQNAFCKQRQ